MKLCPMRFAGYTWHHNPKSLKVTNGKKVVVLSVPYGADELLSFGEKPLTISGVGELYGEDCLEQYERLRQVYEMGKSDVLCLPRLAPMYAYFDSLTLDAQPSANVLTYSFSFTQVKQKLSVCNCEQSVVAKDNQSLWDLSNQYGVDINTLVALNPHIMFLNDLTQGEVVRLC